jgi:hypothetical protein
MTTTAFTTFPSRPRHPWQSQCPPREAPRAALRPLPTSRHVGGWKGRPSAGCSYPLCDGRLTTTTSLSSSSGTDLDSVLSNTDLVVGIVLACLLAALASFLQSQRSHNSDFVVAPPPVRPSSSTNTTNTTTFDDWQEMAQPDNYILYQTRLRQPPQKKKAVAESHWILIALLLLFVPIFSVEFALAAGRPLVCALSPDLCLPYDTILQTD